jgi:hypothetical protein
MTVLSRQDCLELLAEWRRIAWYQHWEWKREGFAFGFLVLLVKEFRVKGCFVMLQECEVCTFLAGS